MKPLPDFEAVNRAIEAGMASSGIPGLAVAVARAGQVIWARAYGWADRERMLPADIHTMFCLASVSKPITATGIMTLVDQGVIALDQPINRYLHRDAQLKVRIGDPEQVTVRRVANHSAGLPLHANGFNGAAVRLKPPMAETIRRYGNITTPPGERFRYSNLGYGILDHLIERMSGIGFSDYLRRQLFLPLGMHRSTVDLTPDLAAFAAVRYDENGLPLDPRNDCDHRGASAVYCSVHDLLRFGLFHLHQLCPAQPVLSKASIKAMRSSAVPMAPVNPMDLNLRPGSAYGLGWVMDDDALDCRISHGGGMSGCAAKLLLLPREGIVIAVVSNQFKPLAYTIENEILAQLLPSHAGKQHAHDRTHPPLPPAKPATSARFDATLQGDWAGTVRTYQDDLPLRLRFMSDGNLHAKLGIQLWTLVNGVQVTDGRLTGSMLGNVNTGDTTRHPFHPFHHLKLDLKIRGDVINGAVINVAGCELNHWTELKKQS